MLFQKNNKPLCFKETMTKGCYPTDGGGLILDEEKASIYFNTELNKFIRPFIGTSEFLHKIKKWCIYLSDEDYELIKDNSLIKERIAIVVNSRESSKKENTRLLAKIPHKFEFDSTKEGQQGIIIPCITSERRKYLPVGFIDEGDVVYGTAQVLYTNNTHMFGVLSSRLHIIWISITCGRMKSDYNYSSTLCYNTFPFPNITDKQKEQINLHVFDVLDERAKYPEKTIAQLYDPDKMPKGLKEAHHQLDLAIERCYRLKPFESDVERLEYLFKMYEEMTTKNSLFVKEKKTKKTK